MKSLVIVFQVELSKQDIVGCVRVRLVLQTEFHPLLDNTKESILWISRDHHQDCCRDAEDKPWGYSLLGQEDFSNHTLVARLFLDVELGRMQLEREVNLSGEER